MGEADAEMFLLVAKSKSLASYPPRDVAVLATLWSRATLNGWSVMLHTFSMYESALINV